MRPLFTGVIEIPYLKSHCLRQRVVTTATGAWLQPMRTLLNARRRGKLHER